VDLWSVKGDVVLSVRFFDEELIEDGMDILEIGNVASGTDNGMCAYLEETVDIVVSCEGTVGRCL